MQHSNDSLDCSGNTASGTEKTSSAGGSPLPGPSWSVWSSSVPDLDGILNQNQLEGWSGSWKNLWLGAGADLNIPCYHFFDGLHHTMLLAQPFFYRTACSMPHGGVVEEKNLLLLLGAEYLFEWGKICVFCGVQDWRIPKAKLYDAVRVANLVQTGHIIYLWSLAVSLRDFYLLYLYPAFSPNWEPKWLALSSILSSQKQYELG